MQPLLLYIELSNCFLIGQKHTVNFPNQRPTADYTNNHVKGTHAKFVRFVSEWLSNSAPTYCYHSFKRCLEAGPQHPPLKHIHLRIDNTTVVAYINKRGGTHSPALTAQALELWAVALTAGVSLTAQHIPGIQNMVADTASRQIETKTESQAV